MFCQDHRLLWSLLSHSTWHGIFRDVNCTSAVWKQGLFKGSTSQSLTIAKIISELK